MSVYLTFDAGPGEQVASNAGWGDLREWAADAAPEPAAAPRLAELLYHGYATAPGRLAAELDRLRAASPPDDWDGLGDTLDGLTALLRANAGAEAVFATDGTGRDGGDDS